MFKVEVYHRWPCDDHLSTVISSIDDRFGGAAVIQRNFA
jgi:hypothetical protein